MIAPIVPASSRSSETWKKNCYDECAYVEKRLKIKATDNATLPQAGLSYL